MNLADALRQRLVAQAELFAALSSHKTITGTCREQALANLLREVLPRRLEVLSGVVARVDGGKPAQSARQVDLIIADTHDFPVLARSGDLAVVLPDSVRAMVEVKTQVSGADQLFKAVKQLAESRYECNPEHRWYSALFSYTYPESSKKLREALKSLIDDRGAKEKELEQPELPSDKRKALQADVSLFRGSYLPDLIVSDKGDIAIKTTNSATSNAYRFYECKAGSHAVVVLVSELLTAVTTEMKRVGSFGSELDKALKAAVEVHSQFLKADKTLALKADQTSALDDLPI